MEQQKTYKPPKKSFRVRYEDYPGLLIVARSTRLKKLTRVANLAGRSDAGAVNEIFQFFSSCIMSWNMEHPELDNENEELDVCEDCGLAEGQLMPSTAEYVACLDIDFVMKLIMGWVSVLTSVSAPKGMNLPSGEQQSTNGDQKALTNLGNLARQTTLPPLSSTSD